MPSTTPPSKLLTDSAVERGAWALATFADSTEPGDWDRDASEQVLTAALRLDDPETPAVERVAKTLYESEWIDNAGDDDMPPWPNLPEYLNAAAYRAKAENAISALLGDDG